MDEDEDKTAGRDVGGQLHPAIFSNRTLVGIAISYFYLLLNPNNLRHVRRFDV